MRFRHRFFNVLASFVKPRWFPNRCNIDQNGFPNLICFGIVVSFDLGSQLRVPESKKSTKFQKFFFVVLIFGVFKIRSILITWVPSWLHVGFTNPRSFNILGFQKAFNFTSFSRSMFYRFGVLFELGSQDGSKSEKSFPKTLLHTPQERF